MASSWAPSSPRPSFHVTKKVAFGCITHQNYTWFKEQFERIIVGYVRDGDAEQLVARARAAILKIRPSKTADAAGRYSCWKIIEQVMKNLVKGAPALPYEIAYIRYCVKRHRLDELIKTSSPTDFIRRLYRIVPNDPQRNNDFDLETLLYREGFGPKPSGSKSVSKKDTEGYAFSPPDALPHELGQRTNDRGSAHRGSSFIHSSAAPIASSAVMTTSNGVDVKPDLGDLKRRAETQGPESEKRHCRSDRLSPAEQEAAAAQNDRLSGDSNGLTGSAELSANFTKLLEKQQQLNAKQSIRIAQLEDMVRVRDTALAQKQGLEETTQRMVHTRGQKLRLAEAELEKKEQRLTHLAEVVADRDAELKVWKTTSPDELRKATKTAQIQRKLTNERQPEAVIRTRVVLENLQEYIHFLQNVDEKNDRGFEVETGHKNASTTTGSGRPNIENHVGVVNGRGDDQAAVLKNGDDNGSSENSVEQAGISKKEHKINSMDDKENPTAEKDNEEIKSNEEDQATLLIDLKKDSKVDKGNDEANDESLEEGEIAFDD